MDDLISRQAAIDALRDYLVGKRCPDDGTLTCRLIENEVVNKLPSALGTDVPDNNVGELISRQQAIDIAKELTITIEGYEMHNQAVMNYCADIMQLPSIQPKRGRWIDGYCSECGAHAPFWAMASTYHKSNFCPNCGADMRGEQDG